MIVTKFYARFPQYDKEKFVCLLEAALVRTLMINEIILKEYPTPLKIEKSIKVKTRV